MKYFTKSKLRAEVLAAILVCVTATGCFGLFGPPKRVATPAELDQFGTKTFPGYSKAEVQTAAVTALKIHGYEVVTEEPRIRTAPKLVRVSGSASYSQYSGTSQSYAEKVAWDIDVKEGQPGPTLHAVPRATVNDIPMEQMYYDYAERTFGEIMRDIDSSLPAKK
jgi:hypothetical protein